MDSRSPDSSMYATYHTRKEHRTLSNDNKTQSDKFKEAARGLGPDLDEGRCNERLKHIARHKPMHDKDDPKGR
jgi:hypothetical protein